MDEKALILINEGKNAQYLLSQLQPLFTEVRSDAVNKLKNMYRVSNYSESKLLAVAAELCSIDEVENKIRAKIRSGQKKSEELSNGEGRRNSNPIRE